MADTIQIDTGVVTSCANQMDQSRQKMMTVADEATAIVNGLGGTWSGNAADAFKAAWSNARQKLDSASIVIGEYVNYLNTTVAEYEATEAARATDNASFEGGQ